MSSRTCTVPDPNAPRIVSALTLLLSMVTMTVVSCHHVYGQQPGSADDRSVATQLVPVSKYLFQHQPEATQQSLVNPGQFYVPTEVTPPKNQVRAAAVQKSVEPQKSEKPEVLTVNFSDANLEFNAGRHRSNNAIASYQDDSPVNGNQERGSNEPDPQKLIEQIRQPLPNQPLLGLYSYPASALDVETKQFLKMPKLKEDNDQFPERVSREYLGQNGTAGPWILEYDFATISPINDMANNRDLNGNYWGNKWGVWASPNARSYPLYFEQVNMERYGNHPRRFATVLSAAHFFGTIPLVPYKMGNHRPRECMYTLGAYRPGSCNPSYRHREPVTARGLVSQALITGAVIGFLPP